MPRRRASPGFRLHELPYDRIRRATPAENVRMGYGPKARRYVLTGVTVKKNTPSISARQAEKKRTGFTSEQATKARQAGALQYNSAQSEQTAAKIRRTAERKRSGTNRTFLQSDGRSIDRSDKVSRGCPFSTQIQ